MATDVSELPPIEPEITGAHTLVRNGLMQTDMDAQGYRILNLDTSNLVLDEIGTQVAPLHKWFNSYDAGTHLFGTRQPAFTDLSGNLSRVQQLAITSLGIVREGTWFANPIDPGHLPVLNAIHAPNGSLNLNFQRIVNLANPFDEGDAVNLRTLNARLPGVQPKQAVRAATTVQVVLAGLTRDVDGVTLSDNNRVLVKNQAAGREHENGIWLAHPGSWTRPTDADTPAELVYALCFVLEGDTHATHTYIQVEPDPCITFGCPTPTQWTLFSTAIVATAGPGLDQTGSIIFAVGTADRISVGVGIDIDENYEGQDSIGIVGTIGQGTWEGDILESEFGGTGANNTGRTITLAGDFNTFGVGGGFKELSFLLSAQTSLELPPLGIVATLDGVEIFTNKSISATQINSGELLISNGGTSANNAVDAITNLLPDQTGQGGLSLKTDGVNVFWG